MDDVSGPSGRKARFASTAEVNAPKQVSLHSKRFQTAIVTDVVAETLDTRSFTLELERSWTHKPGQHIRMVADIEGVRQERCYSLSNSPGEPPKITVKRQPNGLVSDWLVSKLTVGSSLEVSDPDGDFILQPGTEEMLCLAAGSGITPISSMLRHALGRGRAARLFQIDRTPADGIFRGEFRHLGSKYQLFEFEPWFTGLRGRPEDRLKELIASAKAEIYVCGPQSFRDRCTELAVAAGISPDRLHQESFGTMGSPQEHSLRLFMHQPDGQVRQLEGRVGATLLEALRSQVAHPSICGGRGICGTCRIEIDQESTLDFGVPGRSEGRLLPLLNGFNPNHRLACQIRLTAEHDGVCFAAAPLN